jgi:hypothetical protein
LVIVIYLEFGICVLCFGISGLSGLGCKAEGSNLFQPYTLNLTPCTFIISLTFFYITQSSYFFIIRSRKTEFSRI